MKQPVARPHPFTTSDEVYCNHVGSSGIECNRPQRHPAHDTSKAPIPAQSYYDLPDDKDLVDQGIRRCLEQGRDSFSSNDMRDLLDRVSNKKMPGLRLQEWEKKRLIVKLGRTVPSNNPKAKGHHVQVYGPGPSWTAQQKASA